MTIHPDFCEIEDFAYAFPIPVSHAQILRSAKDGSFAPCIRSSLKAPPVFSKREVFEWFLTKYGEASPSLIADLERRLFEVATPAKAKPTDCDSETTFDELRAQRRAIRTRF